MSQAGSERADLLPLEAQICRHGHRRAAATAPTRGGESAAEAAGGGSHAGSAPAARGDQKKAVTPAQQRPLVDFVRVGFAVSERRACNVIGCQRKTCRYKSQAKDQTALRM